AGESNAVVVFTAAQVGVSAPACSQICVDRFVHDSAEPSGVAPSGAAAAPSAWPAAAWSFCGGGTQANNESTPARGRSFKTAWPVIAARCDSVAGASNGEWDLGSGAVIATRLGLDSGSGVSLGQRATPRADREPGPVEARAGVP